MNVRKTDSLIVTLRSSEDTSSLEVYLFDDNPDDSDIEDSNNYTSYKSHIYLHHDIILPALPLCNAYKNLSN